MKLRREVLAVAIASLVVGGLAAGYLAGVGNRQSVTSVTTVTHTVIVYSSAVSPTGLQLELWFNSTSLPEGGGVTAQIHLVNTLARNATMTPVYSSNSTISEWGSYDFFCGSVGAYIGFALFSGHFTPANMSLAGNPLTLAPSVGIPCITESPPASLVWLPYSERVVAYYNFGQPPMMKQAELNATTESCRNAGVSTICGDLDDSLFGYWSPTMPFVNGSNATTSSNYFSYFAPGEYTLVVADLWNQTVYGYFEVQSATSG
jgi:hypothetical protein